MNVFALSEDPFEAARFMCDKHIVKMTSETAQILSSALHLRGVDISSHVSGGVLFAPTHLHHPSVKWAAASEHNMDWLQMHGVGLADEYYLRYGYRHGRQHAARAKITAARDLFPGEFGNYLKHTRFALAFLGRYPELEQFHPSAVECYREYYRRDKARFARWSHPSVQPAWW